MTSKTTNVLNCSKMSKLLPNYYLKTPHFDKF